MELYHVEPSAYGTCGCIVVADNPTQAEAIAVAKYPHFARYKIYVTTIGPAETGTVSGEFLW